MKKQLVTNIISDHLKRIFGDSYKINSWVNRILFDRSQRNILESIHLNIMYKFNINDFTHHYDSGLCIKENKLKLKPTVITLEMLKSYTNMKPKIEKIYEYIIQATKK